MYTAAIYLMCHAQFTLTSCLLSYMAANYNMKHESMFLSSLFLIFNPCVGLYFEIYMLLMEIILMIS